MTEEERHILLDTVAALLLVLQNHRDWVADSAQLEIAIVRLHDDLQSLLEAA